MSIYKRTGFQSSVNTPDTYMLKSRLSLEKNKRKFISAGKTSL